MSATNEWAAAAHAGAYLGRGAEWPPHRAEGEAVLMSLLPASTARVLDLGTGDGRLLAAVLECRPGTSGVAVDGSLTMLTAARQRFAGMANVEVIDHDLDRPLPVDRLGHFDAVVSAFAIHHCTDRRKKALYREIAAMLLPGGVFANLEHVASPTPSLHLAFFDAIGADPAGEDPSNKLAGVQEQIDWLRRLGLDDVDCYWKWRELALLVAVRR